METMKILLALENCQMAYNLGEYNEAITKAIQIIQAQGERIADLENELRDERHRHDRLQDFEVAEAQELAAIKAELAQAKSDLAYLATVGTDACALCKHMGAGNAETCEASDYTCADCTADCRCKNCTGGNFEWRGISKEEQS